MTTTQLTPAQHAILAYAVEHTGGRIEWFPDNIKGGARKRALNGMFNRALITPVGEGWRVAAEGYDALGLPRPMPAPVETDADFEADVAAAEASWQQDRPNAAPKRARENSKLARILELLHSPRGATIGQMQLVTGWQAHTVRGQIASIKKKLGVTIRSTKENGERVYRIGGE